MITNNKYLSGTYDGRRGEIAYALLHSCSERAQDATAVGRASYASSPTRARRTVLETLESLAEMGGPDVVPLKPLNTCLVSHDIGTHPPSGFSSLINSFTGGAVPVTIFLVDYGG